MFNIKRFTVGQLQSNAYLAWDETDDAIIIDPGDDANTIIEFITSNQLNPRIIVATHGHFDHILAVLEIKLAFGISFYMHSDDQFLLNRMRQTAIHYLGQDPGPKPEIDSYLKDKAIIKCGTSTYKIIHTPGHTPGSICLVNESEGAIFAGDLLFADGHVGRTDFSYSDSTLLKKSLRTVLKLPGDYKVLSGHGEPCKLNDLRRTL